jgi:hypothetical protein
MAATLAAAAGCQAGAPPADPPARPPAAPAPVTTLPADRCPGDPGAQPMRRLASDEYDNTLHTLFPQLVFDRPPSLALPQQARWGFNLEGAQTITAVEAEAVLNVATDVGRGLQGDQLAALLQAGCLASAKGAAATDQECARGLAATLGKRAYRRPLFDEELTILLDAFNAGRALRDLQTGVMALVTAILEAPQFLYHAELGEPAPDRPPLWRPTSHEMAARLSSLLWADLPDATLVRAADDGDLHTPAQLEGQVRRMMMDQRARSLALRFYGGWLPGVDLADLDYDAHLFPTFTADVRRDMQRELQRYVDHHFWETDSALSALFTDPQTFVTPALATFYGLSSPPSGSDPAQVALDPARRGGLLMQGAVMTRLAHSQRTSPVQRGKFISTMILCRDLPSPPSSVPAAPAVDPPPNATTRELLSIHSRQSGCVPCHAFIDQAGFLFENFDPVGRWRDTENGRAIDSSGALLPPLLSTTRPFASAKDLAAFLATSEEVRDCTARLWFRFSVGRSFDSAVDTCSLETAKRGFADSGYRLRDLVSRLTGTDAFLYRRPMGEQP